MPMHDSTDLPIVEGVEFRIIERFPGYAFGSDGSVWTRWPGKGRFKRVMGEWRVHKPWKAQGPWATKNWKTYWYVAIRSETDTKRRDYILHRLILEAFVGQCPSGMEGCHNDGNKDNNAISNLRWGTPAENTADKFLHGTIRRGEENSRAKLTEHDIRRIRELRQKGVSYLRIAREYKMTDGQIGEICKGKAWKHVF